MKKMQMMDWIASRKVNWYKRFCRL